MDALTALLDAPKARGAFLLKSILNPPWSLRIEDRAPLTVVTMVRGEAVVRPDGGPVTPLGPGDVAVIRGPVPYTVSDAPGTPVGVLVGPDQSCLPVGPGAMGELAERGVRAWGGVPSPHSSVMITGTYRAESEVGRRLLGAVPAVLMRPAVADDPLPALLAAELERDRPGQELVLDRLLDLLLVAVLRGWFASPAAVGADHGGARGDEVVGPALRLLRERPAHPWTVASLADRVGVSRAALARRFTVLVGETPMAYLTGVRLDLAADLLRQPGCTLEGAARRVGYGSAFALSAAFKRVRGVSPREYREGARLALPPVPDGVPHTVVLGG
ncbi:AraC family transcriptional regulator [Streptomyces calidiresistens]|uniref:Helix-turn-helix domain-containing protein n=1 Tax=Streptomyces calidiresistens TaxID=1485586 RepID=A0A7W3T4Z9_9ACTN|nr:cupin domain-containing protein [Streptomyces calidiresistens]MBB0230911.1 helix-turn-helix domain-containing protein [Streptomyces calidiresistens]